MRRNCELLTTFFFLNVWRFCSNNCEAFIPELKTCLYPSFSTSSTKVQKELLFKYERSPTTSLHLAWKDQEDIEKESEVIPFVIQTIERNGENTFREVASMCIEVFFNEDTLLPEEVTDKAPSPSKGIQLAYLRNAQYSDLRSRKFFAPYKNTMIVARRVLLSSSAAANNKSNFLSKILRRPGVTMPIEAIDSSSAIIYNEECLPRSMDRKRIEEESYVAGEILGFCEVSARPIGLAAPDEINTKIANVVKNENENGNEAEEKPSKKEVKSTPLRPLLTNLAVQKNARKSGIGSRLLSRCEEVVSTKWDPNYKELLLQVEEDNPNAISFYQKRGYQTLYADKTARRFDTTGLLLRQIRSTKVCMRKSLNRNIASAKTNGTAPNWGESVSGFLEGLRKTLLITS